MSRALICFGLLGLASCVEQRDSPLYGLVTTMELKLNSPSPGTPAQPNLARDANFSITARDEYGDPYGGDSTVDVFISYGGVRTGLEVECGARSDAPLETLTFRGGKVENYATTLPVAYGTTSIWAVERGSNVVGASQPIFFPNPTIPNIQTPPDPMAPNATFCTSFEKKFVTVDHATGTGQLLVDSIFGNAITITDTGAKDYRSLYLFTFGRPPSALKRGSPVDSFNGNISKFIGFTEVNFPVVHFDEMAAPRPELLPPPIPLTIADRQSRDTSKLNAANASVVEVSGVVCPVLPPNPNKNPDTQDIIDQWVKYNTFALGDPRVGCGAFDTYSVSLPAKIVGTFDATQSTAKPITVRGMLKNSSGQNLALDGNGNPVACDAMNPCAGGTCALGFCKRNPYNFWTVVVRGPEDITQ